jgi:hypothetical protein
MIAATYADVFASFLKLEPNISSFFISLLVQ